jgi:hypothetical protein
VFDPHVCAAPASLHSRTHIINAHKLQPICCCAFTSPVLFWGPAHDTINVWQACALACMRTRTQVETQTLCTCAHTQTHLSSQPAVL